MINTTILTGHLGKDPETFYSGSGDPVTKFSLAFKFGKDKTGWIPIVAFSKQSDLAQKYLHKGAKLTIIGTLAQSKWEGDDGTQKSSFELIANSMEFIKTDGRGFDGASTDHN